MTNTFYFTEEKLLCWVAGYTADGNSSNVAQQIAFLKDNAQYFADFAKVPFEQVQTYYITASRRYKYMRVFFAVVQPESVPKEVHVSTWKMFDWIHD